MTVENSQSYDEQILNQGLEDEPKTPETPKAPDAKEPLELGGKETPKLEDLSDEERAKVQAEEEEKKRSRPWSKRVDALTARLRDTERQLEELRASQGGQPKPEAPKGPTVAELEAKRPKAEDFEFGAADPAYTEALTDWKLEFRDAQRSESLTKARTEAETLANETAARAEVGKRLQEGATNVDKLGREKYPDFEQKITEAVDARGGEALPELVGLGISISPAGHDIAYRLATDSAASERIEALAKTNVQAAAMLFGELEGEYLEDESDSDLNPSDPLDMARMLGRERARRKGLAEARRRDAEEREAEAAERLITRAPTPAERRARGATAKTEVDDSTDDFDAFERKYMGNRRKR